MKAIVSSQYGPPEVLELKEVPKPSPKANEIMVKIHSTAVNDYDWSWVRGKPAIYRLLFGLAKPKQRIPGMELSGVVEETGTNTGKFKAGDKVYGDTSDFGFGSFAEYICINEKALTQMPENMSFEDACTIPHASMLAIQGLRDLGNIQNGMKVLLNGGGGGVGFFALQIAKTFDCEVTGVDTGKKLNIMKELGYDHVIDYRKEDFTRSGQRYDLILDCKTNRWPFAYMRALKKDGKYITVGGYLPRLFAGLLLSPLISLLSGKGFKLLSLKANRDLEYINKLYEAGKLKCVIDGPYPLSEAASAVRCFGEGKHTGKVVLRVI